MITFVFTRAHTLDRVLYGVGDEIERTQRLGDWLIEQGVPMRRKVPPPAPVVHKAAAPAVRAQSAPLMAPLAVPVAAAFAAPRRRSCCGPAWK